MAATMVVGRCSVHDATALPESPVDLVVCMQIGKNLFLYAWLRGVDSSGPDLELLPRNFSRRVQCLPPID